jgi:hypothetical protein
MSLKEKCAGELELHKPGMLGALLPWRRFFFQLAETEGGSRLYQYGSSRDQADGKAAPSSYDLGMVDDIVEPLASPRAWFELWFSNGAVVRLRSDAEHWGTWVAHFIVACPRVRQRLSSTLGADKEQSVAHGNSPQQLRGEEVRSLRSAALSVPEVALIVGSHPDFAPPAPVPEEVVDPLHPHVHHLVGHINDIKDTLGGHGQSASMLEDRLAHLEDGLRANHQESNKALADLTGIVGVIAGNVGNVVSQEAELSATLNTVLTHVGAVGARVEENTLRVRSDIAAFKTSLEHVEKLCLGLSPKVVVPVGGSGKGVLPRGALSPLPSSGAAGGEQSALGGEILTAVMNHSRAMDEGLSHVIARQKASEDALASVNATLADIARAMVELSNRQEALWKAVSHGSPSAATAHAHSHQQQPTHYNPRAPPPSSAASHEAAAGGASSSSAASASASSSSSPRAPTDGMATLRAQQRDLLAELSRSTGIDLTSSQSVIGAMSRIPLSIRSRADVQQLLGRLRVLDSALAGDGSK